MRTTPEGVVLMFYTRKCCICFQKVVHRFERIRYFASEQNIPMRKKEDSLNEYDFSMRSEIIRIIHVTVL